MTDIIEVFGRAGIDRKREDGKRRAEVGIITGAVQTGNTSLNVSLLVLLVYNTTSLIEYLSCDE